MFNYKFSFFILLVLLVVGGCGTINNTKTHTAFDSKPRGVELIDSEGQTVGHTPLFSKFRKRGRKRFFYGLPQKADGVRAYSPYNYDCEIDWKRSVIPNSLMALVSFPFGVVAAGAFFGLDFFSGGLFDCPGNVHFEIADPSKFKPGRKKHAKRIFPLPIYHDDIETADHIFAIWLKNQFKKRKRANEEVIPLDEAKAKMLFFGIGHGQEWQPEDIKSRHLRKLGQELQVTHLLYFHVKRDGDNLIMTPKLFDIFNQEQVKAPYLERFDYTDKFEERSWLYRTLVRGVKVVPNTITFTPPIERSIEYSSIDTQGKSESQSGKRHPNALPALLTAWGIEDIDYPPLFNSWDYNLKVSPAFLASAWKFDRRIAQTDYVLQVQNVTALVQGSLTLHSPMGALFIGYGLGPAHTFGGDNLGNDYGEWNLMNRLAVMYYAFLSERYFIEIGTNFFNIKNKVIRNDQFELRGWRESYVAIGYYFPEMRAAIERFFGRSKTED